MNDLSISSSKDSPKDSKVKSSEKNWESIISSIHEVKKVELFPIIIKFNSYVSTSFSKKPINELYALVHAFRIGETKYRYTLSIKANDNKYWYLNALPEYNDNFIVNVHPDFSWELEPCKPDRKTEEFIEYMKERANKGRMIDFVFIFHKPLLIHTCSLTPEISYTFSVIVEKLSEYRKNDYKDKVCFYPNPKRNSYYFADIIPIQHLVAIKPLSEYKAPMYFKTASGQRQIVEVHKKIEFSYDGIDKNWTEFDLSPLLTKIHIERTDDACVLCCRTTPSPSHFVLLLSNGNIVDKITYPVKDNEIGFKPIGTECMKKIGSDFLFTKEQINNRYNDLIQIDNENNNKQQVFNDVKLDGGVLK